MISIRHREELHLIAVVIPTWVYAILWRSSFVYTSSLIRKSCNHNSHGTHDYQSHSARLYKQRKTPTSEHSGVITLRKLILAPPRGDDIYISFSCYFCLFFSIPTGIYDWAVLDQRVWVRATVRYHEFGLVLGKAGAGFLNTRVTTERRETTRRTRINFLWCLSLW